MDMKAQFFFFDFNSFEINFAIVIILVFLEVPIFKTFKPLKVNDFIIATGYKHKVINQFIKKKFKNPNVRTFYTGLNSDIVERIKKSSKFSKKYLLVCYGDTLIDINLNEYIKFFMSHPKKITVASYQLDSSFGIFDMPVDTGRAVITGGSFDSINKLLYLSFAHGDRPSGDSHLPLFLAFKVNP